MQRKQLRFPHFSHEHLMYMMDQYFKSKAFKEKRKKDLENDKATKTVHLFNNNGDIPNVKKTSENRTDAK